MIKRQKAQKDSQLKIDVSEVSKMCFPSEKQYAVMQYTHIRGIRFF